MKFVRNFACTQKLSPHPCWKETVKGGAMLVGFHLQPNQIIKIKIGIDK